MEDKRISILKSNVIKMAERIEWACTNGADEWWLDTAKRLRKAVSEYDKLDEIEE